MKKLFILMLLATANVAHAKTIYVAPDGSDDAQLQMGYAWEKETSRIEETIIHNVNAPCGIYNLQGQRVQQVQRGKMYIINGKKVYVR